MGEIVFILKGEKGHREIEGRAKIDHVIEYLGRGDYRIACVFLSDPEQKIVERIYNIDEPVPGGGVR